MASGKLKVLVYGATGVQANPLVGKLLQKGHLPYVMTRHPEKAEAMAKAGAKIIEGDINDATPVGRANIGMDVVALTIPFLASDQAGKNVIDAAKKAGVKLIVWNTSGMIPEQKGERHGLNVRMDNANYLKKSGIPCIIFQPTVYLENLLLPDTAQLVVREGIISYPTPADKKVHWLASQDMAALMVTAMEKPDLAGSHFVIGGEEAIDGNELADSFSLALGRNITYRPLSPADYAARLDKVMGKGNGRAITGNSQKTTGKESSAPDIRVDMKSVLEKLPIQMTSVTGWVREYREFFNPIT